MLPKPLSREFLLGRGYCCHNGCTNCPYGEKPMEQEIKIIKIETNAQNLHGWLALNNADQPVGHIFMSEDVGNKVKFQDAWIRDDYRMRGIYTTLFNTRWEWVLKNYPGWTAYAWCKDSSKPLYIKKGFSEGEVCTYMEKKIA